MSKEQIRNWGIALTSFVLMLCVIAIILAGIDYQLAGPNCKSGFPYDTLPGLQIACIIYSFFMVGWGYIAYMRPSYGCTVSFIVFLVLSIIWNLSIGIFALVSYNVGFVNTYLSCNGQFSGIFSVWQGMDTYLQQVNDVLCSDECPCALTNKTGYVTNDTVLSMYKAMNRTDNKNGAVSFVLGLDYPGVNKEELSKKAHLIMKNYLGKYMDEYMSDDEPDEDGDLITSVTARGQYAASLSGIIYRTKMKFNFGFVVSPPLPIKM